jgi:hypothetical protein
MTADSLIYIHDYNTFAMLRRITYLDGVNCKKMADIVGQVCLPIGNEIPHSRLPIYSCNQQYINQ